MRPTLSILSALAVLILAVAARPAAACVFNAPVCIGASYSECHPTEAERRARERHWSAVATRQQLLEAKARLRSGTVDEAAELAELLVPNVRPIRTRFSDCGAEGEIDYGPGRRTEEVEFRELVAGTALAHADPDDYAFLTADERNFPFGPACNSEFRGRFAAFLRKAVAPAELRQAWMFLSARRRSADDYGSAYHRLVKFEGRTRAPPMQWILHDEWLRAEVTGAIRRTHWGRSVAAAADAFWAEQAGRLGDDAQICPNAVAEWRVAREKLLARIAERQDALDHRRGVRK